VIPIYKPFLPKSVLNFAHDAIESSWISSIGQYREKCVETLQNSLSVKKILMVNNGTSACHLMVRCLKRFYPHIRKVVVPNNVYVAAWNAFLYEEGVSLLPIDANLSTWNFEENDIAKFMDCNTAVLVVHNLGNIVNVLSLKRRFPETVFLEDNCEGFWGEYEGHKSGTMSFCSALSFFGNKTITSGEGGAFLTDDEEVFKFAEKLHGQGQSSTRYVHDELGYNYRMTNVQAAILYGQLQILPEIIRLKGKIFESYRERLPNIKGVSVQEIPSGTEHANWMMGVRLRGNFNFKYAHQYFLERGVEIRPMFYPITYHKHLSHVQCDIKNAEMLSKQCLMVPSFPELTSGEITKVIETVSSFNDTL